MTQTKNHSVKIIVALLILGAVGAIVFAKKSESALDESLVIEEKVKGNPDADIVLTKYSDFQCPACRAASPVIDTILEEYGDQVRFEYHHFPLISIHPQAVRAAQAAEAAGQQGEFFAYHDIVFERQQDWSGQSQGSIDRIFESYAEELGLDMELYQAHMKSAKIRNHVLDEYAFANNRGYSSTPTFTINDERIDYGGYNALKALIEEEIAKQDL